MIKVLLIVPFCLWFMLRECGLGAVLTLAGFMLVGWAAGAIIGGTALGWSVTCYAGLLTLAAEILVWLWTSVRMAWFLVNAPRWNF